MNIEVITQEQIESRSYWIDEISRLSGDFGVDAEKVEDEISKEIQDKGVEPPRVSWRPFGLSSSHVPLFAGK